MDADTATRDWDRSLSVHQMIDRSSPESAHARVDSHEAVCAFRWASVEKQLASLHGRLDAVSNRMWAAAGGLIGLCLVGIAALVVMLITMKGGHP